MIKVAGHWELSWNAPFTETPLWNLPLRDFAVKHWYMWPITGVHNNEHLNLELIERETFPEILEENQDITHVFVEPDNGHYRHFGTLLPEFDHPKDCLYLFGSAHFNPTLSYKKKEDLGIIIPTVQNSGCLWPHQCLVTILYDRMIKECQ